MVYGYHLAVDLGSDALAAYVSMYLESKIKRRSSRRKLYDVALRRKYEYLIGKEVHLQGFHEFLRIVYVLLPLESLSEPAQLNFLFIAGNAFLVLPVSRDTVFSYSVHLLSPDLNLKRSS